jgi:Tfp pilus assembly protein PilZ
VPVPAGPQPVGCRNPAYRDLQKEVTVLHALLQSDRRLYSRTPCDLNADVDDYFSSYSARILNLGKGGAFIQARFDDLPMVGREIILTIPFQKKPNYLIVKARIAWAAGNGIGVVFLKVP